MARPRSGIFGQADRMGHGGCRYRPLRGGIFCGELAKRFSKYRLSSFDRPALYRISRAHRARARYEEGRIERSKSPLRFPKYKKIAIFIYKEYI